MRINWGALSTFLVLATYTALSAAVEPSTAVEAAISFDAQFAHADQTVAYRTLLSAGGTLRFIEQGMTARAVLDADRDSCFATVSWRSNSQSPNIPQLVGPVVVCLVNPTITEDELNAWREGLGNWTLPSTEIGLAASQTPQDDPKLTGKRLWTSLAAASARLFFRGCGESRFRKYGDLHFQPGALQLMTWTDQQGRFQVDLSANHVLLDKPDETTWQNLLQSCNHTEHLPAKPLPGISQAFAGGSFRTPPDPKTVFGGLTLLRDSVATLVFQKRLGDRESGHLGGILDKIGSALVNVRADKVLDELGKFRGQVLHFANTGAILPNDAGALLLQVGSVTRSIERLFGSQTPLDSRPENYCPSSPGACPEPPPCAVTALYVQQRSPKAEADGTPERPFSTITAALTHAQTVGLCAVDIRVRGGTYRGDLIISRHTSIQSEGPRATIAGSVMNRGPYTLAISNVLIVPISIDGADAFGVDVDHPCAKTILVEVAIAGATGYGVRHRGGALSVVRSRVSGTRSQPDFVTRGTGIYLTCGTRATLTSLVLLRNESAALQVSGAGTEVSATNLLVYDTGDHPGLGSGVPLGMGALQVRFGAVLRANLFRVQRSRGVGIAVVGGGSAFFENGAVWQTFPRTCAETTCPEAPVGHNAIASDGGRLRMVNFALEDASLCGLLIARDGQADLAYGLIANSPIGICLQVPGYPRARLTDHVEFIRVGRDIEGTAFAVPEPMDPVELEP